MRNYLLIWGMGGHADVIHEAAYTNPETVSYLVDTWEDARRHRSNHPNGRWSAVLGFGERRGRVELCGKLEQEFPLATLVHPHAYCSLWALAGDGTYMAALAVLAAGAKTGKHCIVNTGAIVEHDCELGEGVHVAPRAVLGGGCKVGPWAWIGIGATVREGVTIGEYATVGAGAVVLDDVPPFAVVVGCPAKVIRTVTKETLPC